MFFNRSDVQAALHVHAGTIWEQCSSLTPFSPVIGDRPLGPALNSVLQHVIESTNNTIIGLGGVHFLLPANGTSLVIQNMTLNGLQGLHAPPDNRFFALYHPEHNRDTLTRAGELGLWSTERSLTFYTVQTAGHGSLIL